MVKNANMLGRFALIGGADAYVYGAKSGALKTVFENCNNLELTAKGDKVDIKEKGAVVMSISKPMSCTLKFTAETTSFDKLAMALGSAGFTKTTEVDTYQKNQMVRVTDIASMVYTLDSEAETLDNKVNVQLVLDDGERVKDLAFTLGNDKKTVTITSDPDIEVGDYIRINYNAVVTAGKMYQFKVPSKSVGEAYRVIIDAIGLSKKDKSQLLMQFEFYKVAIEEGITLQFDGEKATTFDISMTVLADNAKLTDLEGSQFFRQKILIDEDETFVTSITNLNPTATSAGGTFTFSAPIGASSVKLQYKKSTDTTYIDSTESLNANSSSAILTGLTATTSYNARLAFVSNGVTYYSNVVTWTTL